jgi:Na+/H+-translocating membrane pyrophosphatase
MKLEIVFKILAVVLLGAAAVLFWYHNTEIAFAAGVLSACAYFLGMRFQLKAGLNKRNAESEPEESEETEEENPGE